MPDTTPPTPQLSGVDLARVALHAAQNAARKNSATPRRQTKKTRGATNGRDPQNFNAVLEDLVAGRGWKMPVAGGSAVEQWPAIAGERLAAYVQAIAFREDNQELVIHTDSTAWLTQLRLEKPRLLRDYQQALGPGVVRDIVRSSQSRTAPAGSTYETPDTAPETRQAPVITRETASQGYKRARAAHEEVRSRSEDDSTDMRRTPGPEWREPPQAFARELALRYPCSPAPSTRARALAKARHQTAAEDTTKSQTDQGGPHG